MADIDVEDVLSKLTVPEKCDLTAGMILIAILFAKIAQTDL